MILIAPVSPDYNYSWAQCGNIGGSLGTGGGATPLTADAAQGQTTIEVTSTSNFSVGQWVLIDEASGAGWVADPLNATTGFGSVWFSYCDRPTAELHKIASIGAGPCPGSGCTLTFDDPLTIAFRQSGNHNAQVYGGLYSNQSGLVPPFRFSNLRA